MENTPKEYLIETMEDITFFLGSNRKGGLHVCNLVYQLVNANRPKPIPLIMAIGIDQAYEILRSNEFGEFSHWPTQIGETYWKYKNLISRDKKLLHEQGNALAHFCAFNYEAWGSYDRASYWYRMIGMDEKADQVITMSLKPEERARLDKLKESKKLPEPLFEELCKLREKFPKNFFTEDEMINTLECTVMSIEQWLKELEEEEKK